MAIRFSTQAPGAIRKRAQRASTGRPEAVEGVSLRGPTVGRNCVRRRGCGSGRLVTNGVRLTCAMRGGTIRCGLLHALRE